MNKIKAVEKENIFVFSYRNGEYPSCVSDEYCQEIKAVDIEEAKKIVARQYPSTGDGWYSCCRKVESQQDYDKRKKQEESLK